MRVRLVGGVPHAAANETNRFERNGRMIKKLMMTVAMFAAAIGARAATETVGGYTWT